MFVSSEIRIWLFVMYYIYGVSRPSLLIESTNSMIHAIFWGYQLHVLIFRQEENLHLTVKCQTWT